MLPPALRYLPQHGRYEHSLQVCVQGSGVGQEREPSNLQLAFPAPQIRFLTHYNADCIFRNVLITFINALMSPKSARF